MHKSRKHHHDAASAGGLKGLWQRAVEFCLSVDAAVVHADAMPATRRYVDEGKVLSGLALTAIEGSLVAAAGAVFTAAEGLQDMAEAGHKWRKAHHQCRP